MPPDYNKIEECFGPALAWLKKNSPDFVLESVVDAFTMDREIIEQQRDTIESLKTVIEKQKDTIVALDEIRGILTDTLTRYEKEVEKKKGH